jgi:hypothetical protein
MTSLSTYSHFNLEQTISDNPWEVRDEVSSRANVVARQLATLRRKMAKLEAEAAALEALYVQALEGIRVEQDKNDTGPMDDFNYVGSRHHY